MSFKTIILFQVSDLLKKEVYAKFPKKDYHRVFETIISDEVKQIVSMSSESIVVMDDYERAKKLYNFLPEKYRLHLMIYVLQKVKGQAEKSIATIHHFETTASLEKDIDLFFEEYTAQNAQEETMFNQGVNGFFTYWKFSGNFWEKMISSHDACTGINEILNLNWSEHSNRILEKARFMRGSKERYLSGGHYFELIYPHFEDRMLANLSISHIKFDIHFHDKVVRLKKFLRNI